MYKRKNSTAPPRGPQEPSERPTPQPPAMKPPIEQLLREQPLTGDIKTHDYQIGLFLGRFLGQVGEDLYQAGYIDIMVRHNPPAVLCGVFVTKPEAAKALARVAETQATATPARHCGTCRHFTADGCRLGAFATCTTDGFKVWEAR